MFDRRQLVARGAAIVLMFVSFGYARADDANEYPSEVRADGELADGSDISAANGTAHVDGAVGVDQADVIEEIVVIGKNKKRLPNLGSSLGTDPVVKKPGRHDWQFLPIYDPEQAYPYSDQIQLDEQIRRAGFIELFRVRFGQRPQGITTTASNVVGFD